IHGCYSTAVAAPPFPLGVIDSAATCPPGMTPLSWSVTGPQGPQGPQGPAGAGGPGAAGAIQNSYPHPQVLDFTGDGSVNQMIRSRIIPLPPGNWAVTVHLQTLDYQSCALYAAGTGPTLTQDQMNGLTSGLDIQAVNNITLTTTVAETDGQQLKVT